MNEFKSSYWGCGIIVQIEEYKDIGKVYANFNSSSGVVLNLDIHNLPNPS